MIEADRATTHDWRTPHSGKRIETPCRRTVTSKIFLNGKSRSSSISVRSFSLDQQRTRSSSPRNRSFDRRRRAGPNNGVVRLKTVDQEIERWLAKRKEDAFRFAERRTYGIVDDLHWFDRHLQSIVGSLVRRKELELDVNGRQQRWLGHDQYGSMFLLSLSAIDSKISKINLTFHSRSDTHAFDIEPRVIDVDTSDYVGSVSAADQRGEEIQLNLSDLHVDVDLRYLSRKKLLLDGDRLSNENSRLQSRTGHHSDSRSLLAAMTFDSPKLSTDSVTCTSILVRSYLWSDYS